MKMILNFTKGVIIGLIIFCALGLVAHVFVGAMASTVETEDCDAYSLRNRFECAFSLKTPERHKYYYDDYPEGASGAPAGEQRYWAHPAVTYSILVISGVLVALPEKEDKKRNKEQK